MDINAVRGSMLKRAADADKDQALKDVEGIDRRYPAAARRPASPGRDQYAALRARFYRGLAGGEIPEGLTDEQKRERIKELLSKYRQKLADTEDRYDKADIASFAGEPETDDYDRIRKDETKWRNRVQDALRALYLPERGTLDPDTVSNRADLKELLSSLPVDKLDAVKLPSSRIRGTDDSDMSIPVWDPKGVRNGEYGRILASLLKAGRLKTYGDLRRYSGLNVGSSRAPNDTRLPMVYGVSEGLFGFGRKPVFGVDTQAIDPSYNPYLDARPDHALYRTVYGDYLYGKDPDTLVYDNGVTFQDSMGEFRKPDKSSLWTPEQEANRYDWQFREPERGEKEFRFGTAFNRSKGIKDNN